MDTIQAKKQQEYKVRTTKLLELVRGGFIPNQISEVEGFLSHGEVKLALEFIVDFIVENDQPISKDAYELAAGLSREMDSDRGIEYIRGLIR